MSRSINTTRRTMRNDYEAGKYTLSFLEIFINSSATSLHQFDIEDIKTLFHEYIHFLQDISTYYCVYNAALSLQEIALIFLNASSCDNILKTKDFQIPEKYRNQFKAHELSFGDLCEEDYDKKFNFSRVLRQEKRCLLVELVDNHTDAEVIRSLGAIHILEGMANCLETSIFGENTAPYLPYKVFRDVTNKTLNREVPAKKFINICEFSLQCVAPGQAFHFALQEMKKGRTIVDLIENEELSRINGKSLRPKNAAYALYSSPEMQEAFLCVFKIGYRHNMKKFIDSFFLNGIKERATNFYFISDMTNESETTIFERLVFFFNRLGVPNIFTKTAYIGCRSTEDDTNHDSVLLSFLRYFYDEIKGGRLPQTCFLQNDCREKFEKENIVDSDCLNNIFAKSQAERLCPAGALIKSLGIDSLVTGNPQTPHLNQTESH